MTDSLLAFANQNALSLQIGISLPHVKLEELHQAFHETSEALNQQSLQDSEQRIFEYDPKIKPHFIVWEYEDELLFRIEAGMLEEVRQLTNQLFDMLCLNPSFTLSDAKYYCYYLSNQCVDILNRYLKQDKPKTSNSMQNIVSHIFNIEELKDYYIRFVLNITEILKPESIYSTEDLIEKVKLYIQHNYRKHLTQDFVASLFYINRSYLSSLFHQQTGMKFVDYLNEIRIQQAAELLRDSNKKMYQISQAVGYSNPKYFFRIFKSRMGCSPEQYRQKLFEQHKKQAP